MIKLIAKSTAPPTPTAPRWPRPHQSRGHAGEGELISHSLPLITTVATAFGLALVLGFLAVRIKLPALVVICWPVSLSGHSHLASLEMLKSQGNSPKSV